MVATYNFGSVYCFFVTRFIILKKHKSKNVRFYSSFDNKISLKSYFGVKTL